MYTKISEDEKKSVVSQCLDGKSVMELSAEYDIPRSTIYSWIEKYRNLKSMNGPEVCYQDYYNLKRRAGKLEDMLKVIKAAVCGLSAPLQEKLEALERLHGQFSVRTLCDALEVSRGTFYNHIFRGKDVTWYEKRREEMKEEIMTVFDDSE